jgi:hypothetical protein
MLSLSVTSSNESRLQKLVTLNRPDDLGIEKYTFYFQRLSSLADIETIDPSRKTLPPLSLIARLIGPSQQDAPGWAVFPLASSISG